MLESLEDKIDDSIRRLNALRKMLNSMDPGESSYARNRIYDVTDQIRETLRHIPIEDDNV